MEGFKERAWQICKKIPRGKVSTYSEIAKVLRTSPRAVGQAMKKSQGIEKGIPCHRVVNSNGRIGGFNQGIKKKIEMLKKEGVEVKNERIDLGKYFKSLIRKD